MRGEPSKKPEPLEVNFEPNQNLNFIGDFELQGEEFPGVLEHKDHNYFRHYVGPDDNTAFYVRDSRGIADEAPMAFHVDKEGRILDTQDELY